MVKLRLKAAGLWLACALIVPGLLVLQLLQAVFGAPDRSLSMAYAVSRYGNALFGGDPGMTLSRRIGNNVRAGKRWALIAAPCVDFFFGRNHCINAVS